jgi:hypothetical protein
VNIPAFSGLPQAKMRGADGYWQRTAPGIASFAALQQFDDYPLPSPAPLRESLICDELALEAVALELLKIAIIRNVPEPPLSGISELRLTCGGSTELRFAWMERASEQELATLAVGRALYNDIVMDPMPWAALCGELEGGRSST